MGLRTIGIKKNGAIEPYANARDDEPCYSSLDELRSETHDNLP